MYENDHHTSKVWLSLIIRVNDTTDLKQFWKGFNGLKFMQKPVNSKWKILPLPSGVSIVITVNA